VFLFKKKQKNYLGIDISASAIKLVELEKKDERYSLKNYAVFSLKEYFKKKDKKDNLKLANLPNEEVAEIIKRAINSAKIESRNAYLSVPVYSSFSTLVDFPIMSEKEIASSIAFEARKYIPVPISEVVLDWSVVSSQKSNSDKESKHKLLDSSGSKIPKQVSKQEILLIAVPKEIINNYNKIINLAGLELKAIEEETFSLSRSLMGNDKTLTLLVDAGFRSINVSIIDNGYIKLTHNLEMGGIKINEAIAKHMNLSLEEAEEIKIKLSNNELTDAHSARLREIINSVLKIIIIEIRKIINTYQVKYNKKIEKCILTGGGFELVGFIDYFNSELSLDTSLGDPFARIIYPSSLKPAIKELGPSLSVAVGLAMREE